MSTRAMHLVEPSEEDPTVAVSLCGRFKIDIPFPYDTWKKHQKKMCTLCETKCRKLGLGSIRITSLPPMLSMQVEGWYFHAGLSYALPQTTGTL